MTVSQDFFTDRDSILALEDSSFLGADLVLTADEQDASESLMADKESELDEAFQDSAYPPSQSFFQRKEDMEASEVFQFIRCDKTCRIFFLKKTFRELQKD